MVRAISDGSAAVVAVTERPPHLVIADWNIAGLSALALVQAVRSAPVHRGVRLMVLSALSGEHDVVNGLDLGADDYIAKPFSLPEVVARVCALLRAPRQVHGDSLSCDELVLDASTHRATARGRPVNLSGIEYRLLQFFMSHHGRTFNRTQLLAQVWGGDSEVDERTVDVNVQRLRKILTEPGYEGYIQTVRGFGYRFAAPSAATRQ